MVDKKTRNGSAEHHHVSTHLLFAPDKLHTKI